jgi:hypothetical protein
MDSAAACSASTSARRGQFSLRERGSCEDAERDTFRVVEMPVRGDTPPGH